MPPGTVNQGADHDVAPSEGRYFTIRAVSTISPKNMPDAATYTPSGEHEMPVARVTSSSTSDRLHARRPPDRYARVTARTLPPEYSDQPVTNNPPAPSAQPASTHPGQKCRARV